MIVNIFAVWRIGLLLVTYLGSLALIKSANGALGSIGPATSFDFWLSLAQWDGGHYFEIAKNGYLSLQNYAFFPLYPILIRLFKFIFLNNLLLSGLFISNISFLLFLSIFYKLLKEKFSAKIAYSTVITFITFPTTFFAVSYYSEGLFLLLIVCVFLFINRKNYLLGAVFAAFASLTRFVGIMLIVSLFYSYFAHLKFKLQNLNRQFLHLFVAFLGIASYAVYLFAKLNDPFKFLSIQSFWQRDVQDPISAIFGYIWPLITHQQRPFNDYFDLSVTLIFLALLIYGIKKIPSSWWIFSMLAILIPASTGTLTSMPRYALASLGAFAVLGQILESKPYLKIPVWGFFLLLQAIFAVRFINGFWVA